MVVNGKHYKAVWFENHIVHMIDQRSLPFQFRITTAEGYLQTCVAIRNMTVRGAGTIGAAAGFAMAQAFLESHGRRDFIESAKIDIGNTRPTAHDLFHAIDRVHQAGMAAWNDGDPDKAFEAAEKEALKMADRYITAARSIGEHGKSLIKDGMNILTHCNAGWLALVDYGSALSPVYRAFEEGKRLHVWVDETRPRNQGGRLTAWELYHQGIPHTIIPDHAAASLMAKGAVDMVITGADRIAANGDTANKIGTFEKALLAREFGIPFYVAAPWSTFDQHCPTGAGIPIEERSAEEVTHASGIDKEGTVREIQILNPGSSVYNPAFDLTPARLITAFITERGVFSKVEECLNLL